MHPLSAQNDAIAWREPSVPTVCLVIVTYNGKRFLEDCLSAVEKTDYPRDRLEIILVDNGSSDGSAEFVAERFPGVKVIRNPSNLGFAGGNNVAMRVARTDYVALLNNDTRVDPNWLSELVLAAETDEAIGACTSKLVFDAPGPQVIQNAGTDLLWNGAARDRGDHCVGRERFHEEDRGQYDRLEEVFGFCGASALLRRRMLEEVGLFDESFFVYYEDADLSWRARLRGWKIVYVPTSLVRHIHCGTSVEDSRFFRLHAGRNRLSMLVKDAPTGFVVSCLARYAVGAIVLTARALKSLIFPDDAQTRLDRQEAIVRSMVMLSLVLRLPNLLRRRTAIRHGRTVGDEAVMRWMVKP